MTALFLFALLLLLLQKGDERLRLLDKMRAALSLATFGVPKDDCGIRDDIIGIELLQKYLEGRLQV